MSSEERQEETKAEVHAEKLRARITRGDFGTSGRIPSITELSKEWGVARPTVYSAIQLLQIDGWLISKGSSLYVCYPKLELEGITESFEGMLRRLGFEPVMENVASPSIVEMPSDVAAMFGQEQGVRVVHRTRKQGIEGQWLRVAENWYPVELAGGLVDAMSKDEHMDVVGTIKKVHGVYITNAKDVLIPRMPTASEAKLLDITKAIPIVEIRRSNFAEDGTPVMWNKIIHISAFFRFTYKYPVEHWSK